jgi:uncharacterized protein
MQNQKDRVIIDTNLWISFLLTKDFSKFDKIIADQLITLVFSQELVEEIIDVTQRPKFRKYFPLNDVEKLLLKIRDRAIFVNVTTIANACRDPRTIFYYPLQLTEKPHILLQETRIY